MVCVSGHESVASKGQDHVRAEHAYVSSEVAHDTLYILTIELTVGVVKNDSARNSQDFAGIGELRSPQGAERLITLRIPAVGGGRSCSQRKNAGLRRSCVIQAERAAEVGVFVVVMGRDYHQAEHSGGASSRSHCASSSRIRPDATESASPSSGQCRRAISWRSRCRALTRTSTR